MTMKNGCPEWRHNDEQRALNLLHVHLGTETEARKVLRIIAERADPAKTTLEAEVRRLAAAKQIRPLLEEGS